MKTARGDVTVIPLDDGTGRMAVQVDGLITYVGSPEECQRRLKLLYRSEPDRPARDEALGRAIHYA
jgi:ribosomal protein L24E